MPQLVVWAVSRHQNASTTRVQANVANHWGVEGGMVRVVAEWQDMAWLLRFGHLSHLSKPLGFRTYGPRSGHEYEPVPVERASSVRQRLR